MAATWQTTFPNDHMLAKLLNTAKSTDEDIIHDAYGFDKTYAQLLGDIVKTRDSLRACLPPASLNSQGLLNQDDLYIAILTSSGYEFTVALLAVRALGGAGMPFAPKIPLDEAKTFVKSAKSKCILSSRFLIDKGNQISKHIQQDGHGAISVLPISSDAPSLAALEVDIDESLQVNPQSPGLVICTSGTTGPPKGAVLPKCWLNIPSRLEPDGASISHRPPHWIGGATKKITHMGFNPGLLRQLKDVYTYELMNLPDDEREQYLNGFRNIVKMSSSGSMLPPQLQQFWTTLSGRSFEILYGSTETGLVALKADAQKPSKLEHSIGTPWPGVSIKLSEGDEGEILVKHPMIFLYYLGNEEATEAAFDDEGYVKLGIMRILSKASLEMNSISHDALTLHRIRSDLSTTLSDYMLPEQLRIMEDGEEVPQTVSLKPIKREILKQYFGVTGL
ncbi:hypothetical protein G7Z17_g1218 [Cylindrodendrum hubeiense]|uniref:AMP-dependent synthetase/ligase domain-containing protein n=1 Tax=Cylindrodendrum hubeiense TaxID=595255 RepID=A0A9P5LFK0_9HYPO|nr:hypothetical protein G7Z17_g1218 [Cylindrodendrum hubeiense]